MGNAKGNIAKSVLELLKEMNKPAPLHAVNLKETATEEQLNAWEKHEGFRLPDDYRYYLNYIGEARLHLLGDSNDSCSMILLPLRFIRPLA